MNRFNSVLRKLGLPEERLPEMPVGPSDLEARIEAAERDLGIVGGIEAAEEATSPGLGEMEEGSEAQGGGDDESK
jgi:hypothetical protein